jgi:diguanylate cyclase (GGDEF)-like protein
MRDALGPDVDPNAASFLGRHFLGMSGPVWSLLAWNAAMVLAMALNLVALSRGEDSLRVQFVAIAWWAGSVVVLMILRDRTPAWLLHVLLDANVLLICWLSLTAANEVRSASVLVFLTVPAVYAATWMNRQQMSLHLLLIVVASGAVAITRTITVDTARVWGVVVVVTIGLAYFVNALVRHLNEQAVIDPVSGLLNRSGLLTVAGALGRRGGNGLPRTVAVLDLDAFKALNDRDGHAAGDAVLAEVGTAMRVHLRPGDTMARVGGDEFVVVFTRTELAQGQRIIERIVRELPIGCSFGLSDWGDGEELEDALARADAGMYVHKGAKRAKRTDRGDIEVV